MEITLEKIELVKDRTGVTYAEAKAALEEAEGSVVDAIIAIEEKINTTDKKNGFGEKGEALFAKLKEIVKKGNVAKIQVKKDGDTILNAPVNAGIVGIVIAPIAAVVAVVVAFGFKCVIEVVKTDGTIIDVSDAVTDTVSNMAEKGTEKAEILKAKGMEYYEKAQESDILEKAKAKANEAKDIIEEKVEEVKAKRASAEEAEEAEAPEEAEEAEAVEENEEK